MEKTDFFNSLSQKETFSDVEPFLDARDEHVDGDSDPNLSFDGVFGGSEKLLDPQVLLDPFEKQFHLPSVAFANLDLIAERLIVTISTKL